MRVKSSGVMPPNATARVDLTCGTCQVVFPVKPSQANRRHFCSKKCQGQWQSANNVGPANHAWKGGRESYYGPTWRPARRATRSRDKACRRCGKTPKETGKALDVHHLVPFRSFGLARHAEANDISNLIAYCNPCHLLVEWETNRINPAYARWDAHPPMSTDARPKWESHFPEQKGAAHPRAKLTDADVLTIRADYRSRRATQVALATRYNVKQAHISSIVLGKTWSHLPL